MSISLPVNPSTQAATAGKNYLLYINTGTATVPVWTLIGGQRGGSLSRTAEELDASSKTTGGWGAKIAGIRSWEISMDGLVLMNDTGYLALEMAFNSGVSINIKFEYPTQQYRSGWAYITDLSIDAGHTDVATISCTLSGDGEISSIQGNSITPIEATMSKGSVEDKIFTISPAAQTVSAVTCDGAAMTITTHYTYASGTLTIKGTYLQTLSNAIHVFVVDCASDNDLVVRVLVTA